MNKTAIIESQYFGCIEWFKCFLTHDFCLIDTHENFERTTLRNKMIVGGANGKIVLTIPLLGGRNQKKNMKDIKIYNAENWQSNHLKTLQTCYRRTPYFEYFEEELIQFYAQNFEYLIDANFASLQLLFTCLNLQKKIDVAQQYIPEYPLEVSDFRKQFNAHSNQNIPLKYHQPFENKHGFIPNLSMLDMLFCTGKYSLQLLNNFSVP